MHVRAGNASANAIIASRLQEIPAAKNVAAETTRTKFGEKFASCDDENIFPTVRYIEFKETRARYFVGSSRF